MRFLKPGLILPLLFLPLIAFPRISQAAPASSPSLPPLPADATELKWDEFFGPAGDRELTPSAKLLRLNGKRVRLTGFMAKMEAPPKGAFYLCPHPTFCDEEGGGTADLPPEAVRIVVRSLKGKELAFVPRPLVLTGILQIAVRMDDSGQPWPLHLVLDRPQDLPGYKPVAPVPHAPNASSLKKRSAKKD